MLTYIEQLVFKFYQPQIYRPILFITALIALIGCGGGGGDSEGDSEVSAAGINSFSINSSNLKSNIDANGDGQISFTINAQTTAFQIVAFTDADQIRVSSLRKPDGQTVQISENSTLSRASSFQNSPIAFNYPLMPSDAVNAGTYTLSFKAQNKKSNNPIADKTIRATSVVKSDADTQNGSLALNVILSGAVTDVEAVDTLHNVIDISQEILARANLKLSVSFIDYREGPNDIPSPALGDPLYESLSNQYQGINLLIAHTVQNLSGRTMESGAAGNGAAIPTTRSAIAISFREAAGPDGVFDDRKGDRGALEEGSRSQETQHAGSEIAKIILQYLGLPESVTFNGSRLTSTDLYSSTDSCTSTGGDCQENTDASGNILFDYPLPIGSQRRFLGFGDRENDFIVRDRVTKEQREAANLSVLVN